VMAEAAFDHFLEELYDTESQPENDLWVCVRVNTHAHPYLCVRVSLSTSEQRITMAWLTGCVLTKAKNTEAAASSRKLSRAGGAGPSDSSIVWVPNEG